MSTLTIAPFNLPAAFLDRAERAYSQPPRPYHGWSHIQSVLREFDLVMNGPGWRQPVEVALAVLFHDAVYDAGRKDNEAKSAELAREAIRGLNRPAIDTERVVQLIELTARHGKLNRADLDLDAQHFLDCDMAILGSSPADFDAYDRAVAEEYAPHVNALLYRIGRRRFLSNLLGADRLFLSDFFHQRLDAAARANLRRALE